MEEDAADTGPPESPKAGRGPHRQLGKAPGIMKLVSNRDGTDRKGLPSLRSLSVSLGIQQRKSTPDLSSSPSTMSVGPCDSLSYGMSECPVDIRTVSASAEELSSVGSPCSPTHGVFDGPVVSIRTSGSLEYLGTGETHDGAERSTSSPNLATVKSPRPARAVSLHMSKSVSAIAASASNWSVKYKRSSSQRDVRRKSFNSVRTKPGVSTRNWLPTEPCWRPPMLDDFNEICRGTSISSGSEPTSQTDTSGDGEGLAE